MTSKFTGDEQYENLPSFVAVRDICFLSDDDLEEHSKKILRDIQVQLDKAESITERLEKCDAEHANRPYTLRWLKHSEKELYFARQHLKRMAIQNSFLHKNSTVPPEALLRRLVMFITHADHFNMVLWRNLTIREEFQRLRMEQFASMNTSAEDRRVLEKELFGSHDHRSKGKIRWVSGSDIEAPSDTIAGNFEQEEHHRKDMEKMFQIFHEMKAVVISQRMLIADNERKVDDSVVESIWTNAKEVVFKGKNMDNKGNGRITGQPIELDVKKILLLVLLIFATVTPMVFVFIVESLNSSVGDC